DQLALEGFEYGKPIPRNEFLGDEKVEPYGASEVLFLRTASKPTTSRQRIRVGRGLPNHIVLSNASVSFIHAWFEPTPEGWTLTDAGSSNGTFLDGVFLRIGFPALLRDAARISFGLEAKARFFAPDGLFEYLALYRSKSGGRP
ncbi:FHA domain-containing protein, partial [bacterium]|nr:FHA domain-containing protein [bacterium]